MEEFLVHDTNKTDDFKVAILIKQQDLKLTQLNEHYVEPLVKLGNIKQHNFISFALPYDKKKPSAKFAKEQLAAIIPKIKFLGINLLMVADSEYFKYLTKVKKVPPYLGYKR